MTCECECEKDKYLVVYRGSTNTRFLETDWLNIKFKSVVPLSNFSAKFKLGSAVREWDTLTEGVIINLNQQEIESLPLGMNYATIVVIDNEGNLKPFTTSIPVMVKDWVESEQKIDTYQMEVNATLGGTTYLTVNIETARVSLEWVEEKIAEHNESEVAHQDIRESISETRSELLEDIDELAGIVDIKQDKLTSDNAGNNISITEVDGVVKINSTAQGVTVHNQLTGRDSANAHPIGAINGLQDVLNSKATSSDIETAISQHNESTSAHSDIRQDVSTIESYIPNGTSTTNQLATESFVNSSVQTATANFRGNWNTWDEVPTDSSLYPVDDAGSTVPTTNDYLVVNEADDYPNEELTGRWRFKYSGVWATNGKNGWHPEYQVNEEPFTDAQVKAIDSTITKEKVESYSSHISNNDIHVTSSDKTNWNNKQGAINDLNDIRAGATAGATALQPSALNGYATEQWVGQQGYLTIDTLPIYDGSSE